MTPSLYGEKDLIDYLQWPMKSLGIFLTPRVVDRKSISEENFFSIHYAFSQHKQLSLWGITEHSFYRGRLMSKPRSNDKSEVDEYIVGQVQSHLSTSEDFGSGLFRFTTGGELIDHHRGVHRESMWTLDFSYTSQFENELRGVLDLPLGNVSREFDWMTLEFSAPDTLDMVHPYLHLSARNPRYKFHHYGPFHGIVTVSGNGNLREDLEHAVDYLEGVITE